MRRSCLGFSGTSGFVETSGKWTREYPHESDVQEIADKINESGRKHVGEKRE